MVKKGLPGGAGQVWGSARADGYSGSSCQHQRASVDDREATEVSHAGTATRFTVMCHVQATELVRQRVGHVDLLASAIAGAMLLLAGQLVRHSLLRRVGADQRDVGQQALVQRGVDDRLLRVARRGSGSQARQDGSSQQAVARCSAVQNRLIHGASPDGLWSQLQLRTHAIREDELLPEWLTTHEMNRKQRATLIFLKKEPNIYFE